MGKQIKRVCTICARGGSKGVPGKALRLISGRSLIEHTVGHAVQAGIFDKIIISSDSPEILEVGLNAGATDQVHRPIELATDSADKLPAIIHCITEVEEKSGFLFDTVVDLDITAPLRTVNDVLAAVEQHESSRAPNLFSVCPAHRSPYFNMVELKSSGEVSLVKIPDDVITCRQDAPECYDMNASIYVWRRDTLHTTSELFLEGTQVYIMPQERSIDIDSELDLSIAEFLYERR
jgi:CMP-N,N'-diacetyllegionaminic acid synthase